MSVKTKQLLALIIKEHPKIPLTSLMKLSYLIDLVHIKKYNKAISDFKYVRYTYGPFSYDIYDYLKDLSIKEVIFETIDYSPMGDEYIKYEFNNNSDFSFTKLSSKEKKTIGEVIDKLIGLGAKALTELAYRTKPMKKIGAEIGNNKNLNMELDLRAN